MLALAQAEQIASYSIQDPQHPEIEIAQVKHRIHLVNVWDIQPGSRILEIGCGQGTCTAVLAEAVGPDGHVDAVDPAPADYGAPFTLGQAQAFVSASKVGSRVSWHQADPTEFLGKSEGSWDAAVLAHCIWYFSAPEVLEDMLKALKGRVKKVYVAEYALHATRPTAVPHVLAAMTRATLEAHKAKSEENIRSPLGPDGIKKIGESAGWSLEKEGVVVPEEGGLQDGFWEAGSISHASFLAEVEAEIKDPRVSLVLRSGRDAMLAAAETIGGVKKTSTMDVWVSIFGDGAV